MGTMKLPVYDMYQTAEIRYPTTTADVMFNKCYKKLHKYIHVTDIATKESPENKNDKLFKICPFSRESELLA